ANIGVLVGQALTIAGSHWEGAFAPALLVSLVTSGRFGAFWFMRVIVIILALRLSFYQWQFRQRPQRVTTLISWVQVILGLVLFVAIALSSHASAVSPNQVVGALLVDWLHLVAAALWVGGMLYLATSYLPVQRKQPSTEQAFALVTVLPYY